MQGIWCEKNLLCFCSALSPLRSAEHISKKTILELSSFSDFFPQPRFAAFWDNCVQKRQSNGTKRLAAPKKRRFRQLGGWWTPRPWNPEVMPLVSPNTTLLKPYFLRGVHLGGGSRLSRYNKESNNNSIAGWHDGEFAHAYVCMHVLQCNAM